MDKGAWQATVHGVAELDTTELHTHTHTHTHTQTHTQKSGHCPLLVLFSVCVFPTADALGDKYLVAYDEERWLFFMIYNMLTYSHCEFTS